MGAGSMQDTTRAQCQYLYPWYAVGALKQKTRHTLVTPQHCWGHYGLGTGQGHLQYSRAMLCCSKNLNTNLSFKYQTYIHASFLFYLIYMDLFIFKEAKKYRCVKQCAQLFSNNDLEKNSFCSAVQITPGFQVLWCLKYL